MESTESQEKRLQLIESILGFHFEDFFNEVSNTVTTDIEKCMERFKQEILMISKTKAIKLQNDELDEACNKIIAKLKANLNNNMELFELYTTRNIFILPSKPVQDVNEKSSSSSSGKQLSDEETEKKLQTVTAEVLQLREKYLSLCTENQQLIHECTDNQKLLKDMRNSLFNLRVGAQVLDEYNLQPLDETIKTMMSQRVTLTELYKKSTDLNNRISTKLSSSNGTKFQRVDHIKTNGSSDLAHLNAAFNEE